MDRDNYYFMFVRKINGEFFPNNSFSVTVSGVSGKVTSYEMKWDQGIYEGDRPLLTEEKARSIFEKEDRLQLKYMKLNKYNQDESKGTILTPVYIYRPVESDKIDAITGKLLSNNELYHWNYYGYPMPTRDAVLEEEMKAASSDGAGEMIPEKGVISREKAEEIVVNHLKDHINIEGMKLNYSRYTNYFSGIKGKFWYINWYSNEDSKYLSAVVNAEKGEILEVSYHKYDRILPPIEARTVEMSKETKKELVDHNEVIKLVNEKIQTIFPKVKDGLKLEVKSENSGDKDPIYIASS